jgi:hypothetical protein
MMVHVSDYDQNIEIMYGVMTLYTRGLMIEEPFGS